MEEQAKVTKVAKTKNLRQKLQEARILLKDKKIKPSGYNDFTKSAYFSLADILPSITEVCDEVGICTLFTYSNEITTLKIYDMETDEIIEVTSPTVETEIKISKAGKEISNKMQALAGNQTSQRRMLLLSTFDIVSEDDDEIKGIDINNHNIFEIKKRIDGKMTNLLQAGYDIDVICKKLGLSEKQYSQYLNCINVINTIENNLTVLVNDKSKIEE